MNITEHPYYAYLIDLFRKDQDVNPTLDHTVTWLRETQGFTNHKETPVTQDTLEALRYVQDTACRQFPLELNQGPLSDWVTPAQPGSDPDFCLSLADHVEGTSTQVDCTPALIAILRKARLVYRIHPDNVHLRLINTELSVVYQTILGSHNLATITP
tara:strand:+ start:3676 stop:4146 length:471 start_codon:yes stop_codon:yes gene_type:complete